MLPGCSFTGTNVQTTHLRSDDEKAIPLGMAEVFENNLSYEVFISDLDHLNI